MLRLLIPLPALAFLWWLLSDGDMTSWLVGVPTVLAAAWAVNFLAVDSGGRIRVKGLLSFVPYFLRESVRGAVDVAFLVLKPELPVNPGFATFDTRLTRPQARMLFVNSICLLPGTLAADYQGDRLTIHALDTSADFADDLRQLEVEIARLYEESI